MTETERKRRKPAGGLSLILLSTVIAGGIGYVIQAVVPAFTSVSDYIAFSVFWSTVYLIVAAASGVQQEISRSVTRRGTATGGWPTLWRFSALAAVVAAILLAATSPLWAEAVFGHVSGQLIAPLTVATVGYVFIASLSGVYYGRNDWSAAAGMTVSDSSLRLVAIVIVLVGGGSLMGLSWAVALPFGLAALLMWILTGKTVRSDIHVSGSLGTLARHSVATVAAALASGLMISGLPLLLGVSAAHLTPTTLASLILVTTLTRAPLVIPLLALQSYLVVTFRDNATKAARRILLFSAGLTGLTVVLCILGAAIGPWFIETIYSGQYALPPLAFAGIIASAGTTSILCLTGPACLAINRHGWYVAGWGISSIILIVGLILVPGTLGTMLAWMALSPVAGAAVHIVGLLTRRD